MGSIRRSIFIFLCVLVTAATFPQENARRLVAVKKETSNTIKPQLQFSQGHTPSSLVYSPDGKYLASGGTDGTVKIWEATKGKLIRTFVSKDEDGNSRDISFVSYTPDGKTLIGADGENIYFWNVLTGKNIKTINASSSIMAYSSCGKYIAIVEKKYWRESQIIIYETENCEVVKSFSLDLDDKVYINCIAFSPDGKRVVTGDNKVGVKIWDIQSGKLYKKSDRTLSNQFLKRYKERGI